jgi:beta-aspartyl-peptidase (threonine type)
MKKTALLLSLLIPMLAARVPTAVAADAATSPPDPGRIVLVVHGGAGTISRSTITPEVEAQYRASLEQALHAGHAVLAKGGTSLDAVVATVKVFEDDPLFNAGKGAVFTHEGKNELDAAIMDGRREPPPG